MTSNVSFPDPCWLLRDPDDKQTAFVFVLVSTRPDEGLSVLMQQFFEEHQVTVDAINELPNGKGIEFFISTTTQIAWQLFQKLLQRVSDKACDVFVLPVADRKKKLLICDMDSTIVKTETLDDIAVCVGLGEEVSAITTRAMEGDLDFREALDERVKLLTGISASLFDEIADNVQLNDGAESLIQAANTHDVRTVLVSGGFEPIVKRVAEKLGFDHYVCNKLEVVDGKLTGNVIEPIVDADIKLKLLEEESTQLSLTTDQACAVGDGANDLPMLQAAGLGIGFQGKPLVRAGTPYQINTTTLESALMVMGVANIARN